MRLFTPSVLRFHIAGLEAIKMRRVISVALVVLGVCAHSLGGQATSDSAGVRVFTTPAGAAPRSIWRLATAPVFDIGVASGSAEYELDGVRGGAILANGSVLVVNGGTNQLRIYDPAGKHVRSIGRTGQGPGEFAYLDFVGPLGADSLLVWDQNQTRFTVFAGDGALGRTGRAAGERFASTISTGMVTGGQMVAMRRDLMGIAADPTSSPQVRGAATVIALKPDGSVGATIGSFPDVELSRLNRAVAPLVFGKALRVAARGDQIAVGNTDAYSVRVYSAAGRLLRVVRQARAPQPVSDADYAKAKPPLPATSTSPIGLAMNQMQKPANYPAFEALSFDSAGNLWVQDFARSWDPELVWQIFDPSGRLIGRLTVPSTHRLLDATPTQALFRVTDELKVQHVRLYRILSSAPPPSRPSPPVAP